MDDNNNVSSVRAYFAGSCVFLTGASGFAGKSLVQRLLQSCDVQTIYVLLRGKRGRNFDERLEAYLKDEAFSYFKNRDVLDKIVAVEGDISMPRLGLSDDDYKTVTTNAQIIIHAAASVNFTENLKKATLLHLYGTQQLIELCRASPKFKCLVHLSSISTWFVKERLEERVVPFPVDPMDLIKDLDRLSDEEFEERSHDYIGDYPRYPNSYIFTKTLCEVLIQKSAADLKVAIVRLPFIGGAMTEPCPGWLDSLQTLNAMLVCVATGTLRVVAMEPETKPEYLPVDMCSNALLAVAWDMASEKTNLKVYNVTPKPSEVVSVYDAYFIAYQLGKTYPSIRQLLPPAPPMATKPTKIQFYFATFLTMAMAYCIDLFILATRRKPFFSKLVSRINRGSAEISVNLHKTRIYSDIVNIKILLDKLDKEERAVFNFDAKTIDWRGMLTNTYLKFRREKLNEPDSNAPEAIARLRRLSAIYKKIGYGLVIVLITSAVAVGTSYLGHCQAVYRVYT